MAPDPEVPDKQSAVASSGARSKRRAGPLAPSFKLLRVRGIQVGAHWSWLLVLAMLSFSLAGEVFPQTYPHLSGRAYAGMGLVSAILFFGSILLHELGHAFRATKEGMRISGITLWLFGGVARFQGMFPSAGAEFRIAVAGPVVSVALAAVFALLRLLSGLAALPAQIQGVFDYLARINLLLVVFNLIPALPLDGGRILRSWMWRRKRDFTAATVSAARGGKAFGYLLIAGGLFELVSGSSVGGLWFVVMGWFLWEAARSEKDFAVALKALEGITAGELVNPNPCLVAPETSVEQFLGHHRENGHSTCAVGAAGAVSGTISRALAERVPPDRRKTTRVADVMEPAPAVASATPVTEVVSLLESADGHVTVVDGGRVSGVLSMSDVARGFERTRSERPAGKTRRGRSRVAGVLAAALASLLALTLYRPPVVIVSPARPVDLGSDISIKGIPAPALKGPRGRYLLVAVNVSRPSALEAGLAIFNRDVQVMARSAFLPAGVSPAEYFRQQRAVFNESRMAAAAAAATAAGLPVTVNGRGARVQGVVKGSPADGKLKVGDVIVGAGGAPISRVSDLTAITTVHPAGTEFNLTVERGSRTRLVRLKSARIQGFNPRNTGIGITTVTRDLEVKLPFQVEFKERNIGGPSAGLVYALAIADMLDPADIARGRVIAASGTIQLDGRVGPVGGLRQKAEAASRAGADVLLVPKDEVGELPARRRLKGVRTLNEALLLLKAPTS